MVILIRHVESTKNTRHKFSSDEYSETLTSNGVKQANVLAENLYKFITINSLTVNNIHCAESPRGILTSSTIGERLKCNVVKYNELKSFKLGKNAGISENKLKKVDPIFYNNLVLYRKALLNSYNIIFDGTKETLVKFEENVCNCISHIISDNTENCKIIILHRSALTAYLLSIARKEYGYPVDFYGYIKLTLGYITIIETNDDKARMVLVNTHSKKLQSLQVYMDNNEYEYC